MFGSVAKFDGLLDTVHLEHAVTVPHGCQGWFGCNALLTQFLILRAVSAIRVWLEGRYPKKHEEDAFMTKTKLLLVALAMVTLASTAQAGTQWYWGDSDAIQLDINYAGFAYGYDSYWGYLGLSAYPTYLFTSGYAYLGYTYPAYYLGWYYGNYYLNFGYLLDSSGNNLTIPGTNTGWSVEWSGYEYAGAATGFMGMGLQVAGSGAANDIDARLMHDGRVGFFDWGQATDVGDVGAVTPGTTPTHFQVTKAGGAFTLEYGDGSSWTVADTYTLPSGEGTANITLYLSQDTDTAVYWDFIQVCGSSVGDVNLGKPGVTANCGTGVIVAAPSPPKIGEIATLTAPAGSGYDWKKGGVSVVDAGAVSGQGTGVLTFNVADASHKGLYTVDYDDGSKVAQTSLPFNLNFLPVGVPAATALGLSLLGGALVGGGTLAALRRRKQNEIDLEV